MDLYINLVHFALVNLVELGDFTTILVGWVGGVEIGISLRFDKKYFGQSHFRFVIFSLV